MLSTLFGWIVVFLLFSQSLIPVRLPGDILSSNKPSHQMEQLAETKTGRIWHIETVDIHGYYSAIAFDDNDNPHLGYEGGIDYPKLLIYARRSGNQWQLELVDDMELGGSVRMVLDHSNDPHISYSSCNPFGCSHRYAHWNGVEWLLEDMPINGSIAVDSSNFPHIASDETYMYWSGSQWITETLGFMSVESLKFDPSNILHVSGYNDAGNLIYAYKAGGEWHNQIVDSSFYGFRGSSLALDSNNLPQISYIDRTTYALKFARYDGDSWETEIVDPEIDNNMPEPTLVISSNNQPCIAYPDDAEVTPLNYACRVDGSWHVDTIDTGDDPSLALDSLDMPHISYYSISDESLNYAWGESIPVPPGTVEVAGADKGFTDTKYTFTATVNPFTATVPITYTWIAEGQPIITHTNELTDTVSYSWGISGTQLITVTASNSAGEVQASKLVDILVPEARVYIPLISSETSSGLERVFRRQEE